MADNTIRITAFDLDETFEEAKVRDIDLSSVNEKKAELISEWWDVIYEELKLAGEKIDSKLKEKGISSTDEGLDRRLGPLQEELISNQLLDDNYEPPNEAAEILWHLESLRGMYLANFPLEATCRLDVSAFKLLPKVGQLLAGVPGQLGEEMSSIDQTHKRNHSRHTILQIYKGMGIKRVNDQRSFLADGKKMTLNKLGEEILIKLRLQPPKGSRKEWGTAHIQNILRQLIEEEEI